VLQGTWRRMGACPAPCLDLKLICMGYPVYRIPTIMESIQRMVLQDSPLVALAQQGLKQWAISLQQNPQLETIRVSALLVTGR
jgi:hypothetical protein